MVGEMSPDTMPERPSSRPAPVVVSMGGSVLFRDEHDDAYLSELADLLRELGRSRPLLVTAGGGRTAREYIRLGRRLGLTEVELDELGIDITRVHARLLAARIGPPCPARPPTTVAEAVHELRHASPVVLGGTEPGHSTDGVAALLAARVRAERLVNATDVDGIYEEDPHRHPGAHRIERIGWEKFRAMVESGTSTEAGQNFLFDRLGALTLARARIPLWIVDGRDLSNLRAAVEGTGCRGSRVED